jgi:amidohydrolase
MILRKGEGTLVGLRHALHRQPELSGDERGTAAMVIEALTPTAPDEWLTGLGGHGVAAVYSSEQPGPTVLLRAELDALPMTEPAGLVHRSAHDGVAHKCGHDGHMAILMGVASVLQHMRPPRGKIVLLFQPAEETGMGAARVIADPKFAAIRPDVAFALHNLPGLPLGEVRVGAGPITAASVGLHVRLTGQPSHASAPMLGRNPARTSARLIDGLLGFTDAGAGAPAGALVTIAGFQSGDRNFGISPGEADIFATLRCHESEDLTGLVTRAEALARELAAADGIEVEFFKHDEFPASVNDAAAASVVARSASLVGMPVVAPEQPFPWSEDFGHILAETPGALFVIGAGEDASALHTLAYDFADSLIEPAALVLLASAFFVLETRAGLGR